MWGEKAKARPSYNSRMSILDEIVARKRQEIEVHRRELPESALREKLPGLPPPRDFLSALASPATVQVIAELKRASPSAGSINPVRDLTAIARTYEEHGAACLSVLTDGPFFAGSLADLEAVRAAVRLPLLRKDFILEPYQVLQARLHGADAVLLIAEILDDGSLRGLRQEIEALGMTALVECYTAENLRRVLASGATLVGINNRNLHTFATSLAHTEQLAVAVPDGVVLVSESGIQSRADVERVARAGAQAVLVGESLMRSADLPASLRALQGVAKRSCAGPP